MVSWQCCPDTLENRSTMSHDSRRPMVRLGRRSGMLSPPPMGTNSPYILLTLVRPAGTPYPTRCDCRLCLCAPPLVPERASSTLRIACEIVNYSAMTRGPDPVEAAGIFAEKTAASDAPGARAWRAACPRYHS